MPTEIWKDYKARLLASLIIPLWENVKYSVCHQLPQNAASKLRIYILFSHSMSPPMHILGFIFALLLFSFLGDFTWFILLLTVHLAKWIFLWSWHDTKNEFLRNISSIISPFQPLATTRMSRSNESKPDLATLGSCFSWKESRCQISYYCNLEHKMIDFDQWSPILSGN